MGQKVNPIIMRIGITKKWDSMWFAERAQYTKTLKDDITIRDFIKEKMHYGAISKIKIEHSDDKVVIIIYTAKPGVIIGKKGSEIEGIRKKVADIVKKEVYITPQEVTQPELDAQLVAETIARQLAKRVSYRKAARKAMSSTMNAGAKGIKVMVSGRLGGSEIARSEWYRVGRVPLHTFRADIDYGFEEAYTTYGRIGVKIWIYKGDILSKDEDKLVSSIEEAKKEVEKEDVVSQTDKVS